MSPAASLEVSLKTPLVFLLLAFLPATLRGDFRAFEKLPVSHELTAALGKTAIAAAKQFPALAPDNLALSVIDLTKADAPVRADYHGDAPFYPASLMKLFVMIEAFQQGQHTPEIDRALREMIAVSDNDATAYLIDVVTKTTAGPELEGKALAQFTERRRRLDRHFHSLGYDVSLLMKPWSFGPYGREKQLLGADKENRNRATANSFASLLYWIVRRQAVSPEASAAMLDLLARPLDPPRADENQIKDFLGEALPPSTKLWSKAGNTSEVRHDAAYLELPDGRKLIVVILTRIGEDKAVLRAIGKSLLDEWTLDKSREGVSDQPARR